MQIKSKSNDKRKNDTKPQESRKEKVPKKITERYLFNAGTHYLQRFTSSSAHFKFVMMRKVKRSCAYHTDQDIKACEEMVDALVTKCEELGLLNDQAYLRGMVTSLRRSGKSKRAIEMKLRTKGLCTDMITDAINDFDASNTITDLPAERQAALIFAKKRKIGPFRKETSKSQENVEQKELGRLARAGFSYDVCRFILDFDKDEYPDFSTL